MDKIDQFYYFYFSEIVVICILGHRSASGESIVKKSVCGLEQFDGDEIGNSIDQHL